MPTQPAAQDSGIAKIGPDQVSLVEGAIAIDALHRMPDWEVRELHPVPVYFQDAKYQLVQVRRAEPPFAVRYMLRPWPGTHITSSAIFWTYDEETVAEREADRRSRTFHEIIWCLLLPFYPFLGLLWSGTQQRLTRFGFVPRSITSISIFTSFCIAFFQ